MFPGEEKSRKVIEKIIAATEAGLIRWEASEADFNQRFYAIWQGWKLTAIWFQDETSFEMFQEGKASFRASYRVMDGLHKAVLDQVDPDREKNARKQYAKDSAEEARRAREAKATIDEILNLP